MKLRLMMTLALAVSTATALAVAAEKPELDPLLQLLVEQGVITEEQALGVQAESERRAAQSGRSSPAEGPEQAAHEAPAAPPSPVATAATDSQKWYDRLEVKGDLRLRYEGFWIEGISDTNHRSRFRLRVRPGLYASVTDRIRVGFQVRSGDPQDPVSDNQSLDEDFSMKQIAISEAFAAFEPAAWLGFHAGKFDPKNLWLVSDMQWDDDVTVEGLMENLQIGRWEASVYQFALEERSAGDDAFLLGGQMRGVFDLGERDGLTVGIGYDAWVNPQYVADLTLEGDLRGNRVTNLLDDNGQLVSDFRIANAFVEWSRGAGSRWPIRAALYGYHNFGARDLGAHYDNGYFIRVQVGDYKEKGQVAFRASRYYSEPDALFYVFAQSDTTMASDVDGYRFDVRIGWVKRSYFNLTWYHTDTASDVEEIPTMDRLQVDYIIRF